MAASHSAARSHMMDNLRSQTARMRKTFRYPDDEETESVDSQPEAMDEQEQEAFITRLAQENKARNETFARILIALPLATTLPYIPALLSQSTRLFALLSITSLLSTAYLLYQLPHTDTGIPLLDQWIQGSADAKRQVMSNNRAPLEMYLPLLNLGLTGMLVLMGLVKKNESASFAWIGMGNLPGIVYAVVLLSKVVMASVDPEGELSSLKYEYKGA